MNWRRYTHLAVLIALVSACLLPPQMAAAVTLTCQGDPGFVNYDGRCIEQGYFAGQPSRATGNGVWQKNTSGMPTDLPNYSYIDSLGPDLTNTWAFPSNVDNGVPGATDNFINFMHDFLFQGTPGFVQQNPQTILGDPTGCWDTLQNYNAADWDYNYCDTYRFEVLGAAFIILTMLGGQYTTYNLGDPGGVFSGCMSGGSPAVLQLCAQNGIQAARDNFNSWENDVKYADSQGGINWNQVVSLPDNHPNSATRGYGHDVSVFLNVAQVDHSIVFNTPSGQYTINRRCANTDGFYALAPAPPPALICDGFNTDVAAPDPKVGFHITASVKYNPDYTAGDAFAPNGPDNLSISVAGPSPDTTVIASDTTNTPALSNGDASIKLLVPATNNTGTYNITWQVNGSKTPTITCSGTIIIANEPTFSVRGGDAETGASMGVGGTDCATAVDPYAGIVGWNTENPSFSGAGTEYAALALNYLQDFATAQKTASQAPKGLSFSNSNNVNIVGSGKDTYGGAFGSENCIPDYFSKHPATPTYSGFHTFDAASDIGKTIYMTGTLNINLPISVPNGSHTTIYVDGNVQDGSDINYSNSYPGGVSDIPSFTIIVSGNIYVSKWAKHLDGWFIAEPSSPTSVDGIFYTCAPAWLTAPALDATLYGNCNIHPLAVNGAVIARQVWLARTTGTLYADNPAETFTLTPETWLNSPLSNSGQQSSQYDSITNLPPSL